MEWMRPAALANQGELSPQTDETMDRILVVTSRRRHFADFAQELTPEAAIRLEWADSGTAALSAVQSTAPLAVVVDEYLSDMSGRELVRRLLFQNAMIHAALVSGLAAEAFHQATEGLGILLQLPPDPTRTEARILLDRLNRMAAHLPRRNPGFA